MCARPWATPPHAEFRQQLPTGGRIPLGVILGLGLAVLFAGVVVLVRFGRGREWERRKAAVLATTAQPSVGTFRMAFQDAVALSETQGRSDWLDDLRHELEIAMAASHEDALRALEARFAGNDRTGALTDWKGRWAVHRETPPSPARTARETDLRALGTRLAHALALAEADAGRPAAAFSHHATADEVCDATAQDARATALHAEFSDHLRGWLTAQRPPLLAAVAANEERLISAIGAPVAEAVKQMRAHDAGPGPRLDPALAAEFDAALAVVPVRRVAIVVIGDESVAQQVRALCRFAYPYELVFASYPEADATASAPAGDAWATVQIRVEWTWLDYHRVAGGVQWAGDTTLPTHVALSCAIRAPEGVVVPWPVGGYRDQTPAPETIKVRQDHARADFDGYQREFLKQLKRGLQAHLTGWQPWELPAREDAGK